MYDDKELRFPVAAANNCWFLMAVGHSGSLHKGSRQTLEAGGAEEPDRLDAKLAKNGLEAAAAAAAKAEFRCAEKPGCPGGGGG